MSFNVPAIHVNSHDTTQFPSIELLPTSIEEADASGLFPISEEVTRWIDPEGTAPQNRSAEEYYKFSVENPEGMLGWGIRAGSDNEYIGAAGLDHRKDREFLCNTPVVSLHILNPNYLGKRIGRSIILGLAHYAFAEMSDTEGLVSFIDLGNTPSIKMHSDVGYLRICDGGPGMDTFFLANPDRETEGLKGFLEDLPSDAQNDAITRYRALAESATIIVDTSDEIH
jgi:hypothetical protein